MRLGGFVIHGGDPGFLGRCLDSLVSVADECVVVDTSPAARGAGWCDDRVRRVSRTWEGFGAARVAAAEALSHCDYLFFLDSDEWLEAKDASALRSWKASSPSAPHYALLRRDWAQLNRKRFLYRTERHVRLLRRDAANWRREMIVHETPPRAETIRLPIGFEHHFADDIEAMRLKVNRYALLWAIQNRGGGRRIKPPLVQHAIHLVREAVIKGAVFRGGISALELAAVVASHSARKYAHLRDVRAGAHQQLVQAFEEGRLADLFRLLESSTPG